MKTRFSQWIFFLLCLTGAASIAWMSPDTPIRNESPAKMRLVWADEFDYTGLPDSTRWGYDVGDGCPVNCFWGNNELQYYTERRLQNARVEEGHLVIEARRESMGTREYTSARLVSKHKGDWTYGKIVARAKLPSGRGVWPAIWMLPTDWVYGGWPSSGEIDIMEHVGFMPDSVFGTVHTNLYNGALGTQKSKGIPCQTLYSEFHEYGVSWDESKIEFLFDGHTYYTFPNNHEGSDAWPFDLDFHMVLNIAVGGNWGGKMGVDTTVWPQQMVLDYVRVYQRK